MPALRRGPARAVLKAVIARMVTPGFVAVLAERLQILRGFRNRWGLVLRQVLVKIALKASTTGRGPDRTGPVARLPSTIQA